MEGIIVFHRKFIQRRERVGLFLNIPPPGNLTELPGNPALLLDTVFRPEPFFAAASAAVDRAMQLNPQNATSYQTAAEVHRWRAEWLKSMRRDPVPEIAAGRVFIDRSLQLNPTLAKAMVTGSALLVIQAESTPAATARRQLIQDALASLNRAVEINPMLEHEARALRERAELSTPTTSG